MLTVAETFISPNYIHSLDEGSTTVDEKDFMFGLGWIPDLPDYRDFNVKTDEVPTQKVSLGPKVPVQTMLAKVGVNNPPEADVSAQTKIDLSAWCSPIENQGNLGSCTAHAAVGMLEYYERRAFNKHIDGSRRFVYKVTRNLLGVTGDTGAYLRSTMGALALLGVPPEKYWPYNIAEYETEPSAFVYALGQN
jgi:C1A family cysteine protease